MGIAIKLHHHSSFVIFKFYRRLNMVNCFRKEIWLPKLKMLNLIGLINWNEDIFKNHTEEILFSFSNRKQNIFLNLKKIFSIRPCLRLLNYSGIKL